MFYALAQLPPPPPPVIRVLPAAPLSGSTSPAASPAPQIIKMLPTPARKVVQGSVFEMPPGLPAFLTKPVVVPKADAYSEFAVVASVARQVGVPFTHSGPDYALLGTQVPFGRPVPAYELLWYAGHSYVPGMIDVDGSGAIRVVNQKP